MICIICRKTFVTELDFSTLFKMPYICEDCLAIKRIEPEKEIIPSDNGIIEYYYISSETKIDKKMYDRCCHFIEKPLEMAICRHDEFKFILILEPDEFDSIELWWPLVKESGVMMLFSIFRYDFLSREKEFCF